MDEKKHVCPLCDYIYDESKGDSTLGLSPGTKFEDLPEGFQHQGCKATVDMFESCSCASLTSSKGTH